MNLKPCPYRHVGDEGHILCEKIKTGDRQVSPNICRVCPISQINCAHLRATLDHQAHPPVTVRWGNSKTEIWEDDAPSISFNQAACAEKVIPIQTGKECAGCALRQPLITAEAIASMTADRRPQTAVVRTPRVAQPARAPMAQPVAQMQRTVPASVVQAQPVADARSNIVAQKIIQLQEWFAKQKNAPSKNEDEATVSPIQYATRPTQRVVGEERRTGWTD